MAAAIPPNTPRLGSSPSDAPLFVTAFAFGADIRVTHDEAKMGFTFVGLGLHPGMGITHTLAAAAGGQAASRMLLTGDVVRGAEAARLGLVAHSLPDAEAARAEALAIARRIAAQSPLAVRATFSYTLTATSEGCAGFEPVRLRAWKTCAWPPSPIFSTTV